MTANKINKGMTKNNIDIEDIIDLIIEGETLREIAQKVNVKLSTLHLFLTKAEHSARVGTALQISADSYADKAEQVLKDAESNLIEVQRARELAQHYRWKASKRSPKVYGDKMDITSGDKPIVAPVIQLLPPSEKTE